MHTFSCSFLASLVMSPQLPLLPLLAVEVVGISLGLNDSHVFATLTLE